MIDVNRLPIEGEDGLIDVLRTVVDPRKRRGIRHPLVCILAIAVCACLSGARSFEAIAEWASELSRDALKRLGSKRSKAPSEKCFRITLQRLDASGFDGTICSWLANCPARSIWSMEKQLDRRRFMNNGSRFNMILRPHPTLPIASDIREQVLRESLHREDRK